MNAAVVSAQQQGAVPRPSPAAGSAGAPAARGRPLRAHGVRTEPAWIRALLIAVALAFFLLFLVLPLLVVFGEAFRKGAGAFLAAFSDPDTTAAIATTLACAAVAVPLNTAFGIVAAWTIAKFDFRGRTLLMTLVDLPFSVSPVVAGLIYVLVFGAQGWLGAWLAAHDLKVIFAVPGIVLATVFVTFPFVVRELVPVMEAQGTEEEEAAVLLGAGPWQLFRRVTLPNIRWGLLYGVALCNARAMGEFGAVSVVSGHIRGRTDTIPLQVEILYNDYNTVAAFALASVLALLALVTLVAKALLERQLGREARRQEAAAAVTGKAEA